jgi:ATP adenylyltransferase
MDHLWSPWRYVYVSKAEPAGGCVFCVKAAEARDAENFIVYRGALNYVLLNIFPYTSGHMLIVPYEHVATLEEAGEAALTEMMLLAQRADRSLRRAYRPGGVNLGMNIGECAGAGIAGHIHMHIMPRWPGDVSFMSTVAETRVIPEDLDATYRKLLKAFAEE